MNEIKPIRILTVDDHELVRKGIRFSLLSVDGVAATRAIRDRYPQTQVVALSSFYDRNLVQGVMQAGAIGYLVKGSSGKDLLEAIRAAHSGRSSLANEAVQALIQESEQPPSVGVDLTEQESIVLAMLVEGLSNPQIAETQNYSVAAVKYHVSNILAKLGAANRTEAVAIALEHNLVSKKRE